MTSHTEALTGGPLRAAISDEISHLLRRHAGQGPTQARTYLQDRPHRLPPTGHPDHGRTDPGHKRP